MSQHFLLARFFLLREFSATTTKLRVRRPLHHGSLAARAPVVPLPRYRGGGRRERSHSRDAAAPEVCRPKPPSFCLQKNKGRRSAEKARLSRGASPRDQMLPPVRASGVAARSAERARLSALHRGACLGHVPKLDPGRASRDAARGRYPHLGTALKRSTSRAGRNAGGVDARTAREQK